MLKELYNTSAFGQFIFWPTSIDSDSKNTNKYKELTPLKTIWFLFFMSKFNELFISHHSLKIIKIYTVSL